MSPRPRRVPDTEVMAGVGRVVGRAGPHGLTLAAVAAEVGLAPATLVQRYGSRRGLMRAFAERAAAEAAEPFERARDAAPGGAVEGMVAALVAMTAGVRSAEELVNHLALLQLDLADAELLAHARTHAAAVRGGIRDALERGMEGGEVRRGDARRLAATVHAVYNGSLLTWAVERSGPLEEWLERDLATVLEPWRAG